MALTNQQIAGLDIASQRKAAGTATETDVANLNYAAKQGYVYKPAAPSPAPASVNPNPAPAVNANPAAANPNPGEQPAPASGAVQPADNQNNKNQAVQPDVDPAVMAKPGIANLLSSGRAFTEEDAKNFAYAKGETNWQQYVNGIGGQTDPNYIGANNWARLQKTYTPYQLEKATIRTKNGIYWNPEINIAEVSAADPAARINADTKKLADVVGAAKGEADKFTNEDAKKSGTPTLTGDLADDKDTLMAMLNGQFGGNAEAIYNDLYNTPEMKAAQSDVNTYKNQLDEYDQQLDELKDDIRREVEGEASDSYISALATVRGEKILKAKRSVQRDYDTALAVYNGIKENAANLLQVRVKDADTRYNQLFSMLQLEIQQAGTAFNQEMAIANLSMQIPEGRSMTINGETVKGLKENDDLNVVQFTAADGKTYVLGVDKKTGETKYKTLIGTAKVAGSGTAAETVDLNTALYWLSLSKNKDGEYDLGKIPEKYRSGVVEVIAANKDSLPAPEKTWWERQKEDLSSGTFWNTINPFD